MKRTLCVIHFQPFQILEDNFLQYFHGKTDEGVESVFFCKVTMENQRGPSMKPGSKGESWPVSFFKDATKASPAKQLTIGGISGWCVGFVFTKAGKIAATAIGGSLLLFQIAQHQGYVKVNWSRLNKDLQQAQNELARRTDGKLPRLLEEAQKFVKDNVFLATGFAGGFLLGVASS
ncbi:FUN14 domain-containing protein 1-like isoform X2 [Amblyomma americanum]|uniref:Fun14 family protein n=6 Tax=Amblyomma TaxID=6942 RepID=A0AAQ4E9B0_AMBAM